MENSDRIAGRGWLRESPWPPILVLVSSLIIPQRAALDWFNVAGIAGAVWLGLWYGNHSRRNLGIRAAFLFLMLIVAAEFGVRTLSYHRSLMYERAGDLLFTPVPNQEYIEKISLTPSRINSYGLRGGPVAPLAGHHVILCLGDSITYGYGVDDKHTYPELLQLALEKVAPERFQVLNGGVNAYPMSFIHQRFLNLWNKGLRPRTVLVGYSMNEGWLGHLVDADEATKNTFVWGVRAKNWARSSGLYNLVIENWARYHYDRIKTLLVPGTHNTSLPAEDWRAAYVSSLDRFVADLRTRGVQPMFVVFAALDPATARYDTKGPFQEVFADYAKEHSIPLIQTDEVLRRESSIDDISAFFMDAGHMNNEGNQLLVRGLGGWLAKTLTRKEDISWR